MPTTNKLQLVAEAQKEQLGDITDRRLALRNALDDMEAIGGKDEYDPALLGFLEKYNEGTTTTEMLREVYTDARQLKKALKSLKDAGKITVEEKGQTTFVTLVKVQTLDPASDAAAPAKKAGAKGTTATESSQD